MLNSDVILKAKYPQFDEEQYQPAGIDLRAGKVYMIDSSGPVVPGIYETGKKLPKHVLMEAEEIDVPNFNMDGLTDDELEDKLKNPENLRKAWVYKLEPNVPYIVETKDKIYAKHAGQIYLPRSTLLRSGINVMGAFGDPGFHTHLFFLLINYTDRVYYLEQDSRFMQLLDLEIRDLVDTYDGEYNDKG